MSGTLLASDDPRIRYLIEVWPEFAPLNGPTPRSRWLRAVEDVLRELHPTANSDSLTLTARTLAPFPLQLPGEP